MDVHPPDHPIHTWKDFFIHIATIVVGLLIAVGLEQTVELFHHRHQVAETREALHVEREQNIQRFAIQTEEFRRILPVLQTNMAIFQYLHDHPGAPQEQWPGKLHWWYLTFKYNDAAWKTAQNAGVIALMARSEVQYNDELYNVLGQLTSGMTAEDKAQSQLRAVTVRTADLSRLTPAEVDRQLDYMVGVLNAYVNAANMQQNVHNEFPDFGPAPERKQYLDVLHIPEHPEDMDQVMPLIERLQKTESDHAGVQ